MQQQRSEIRRRLRPGLWSLLGLAALVALVSLRVEAQRADGAGDEPDWAGKPGYHWRTEASGDAYVFLGDGSTIISASDEDVARAGRAIGDQKGLWFEIGGRAYLIRDAATLAEIETLYRPQIDFAGKQQQPGKQHGGFKAREEELMNRRAEVLQAESELRAQRSELAAEQDNLVRQGKSASGVTSRLEELGRQQREVDAQLAEIREQEEALSQDRAKLWKQEEGLGNEHQRLAQSTESKLRALMQRAVATGIAQPVQR